jgi:hypothetical protein
MHSSLLTIYREVGLWNALTYVMQSERGDGRAQKLLSEYRIQPEFKSRYLVRIFLLC